MDMFSWNTVKSAFVGDGDGVTPEDTIVCRNLRHYYSDPKTSKKYPYWPDWIPGPRPANLPVAAPVLNIGSNYGNTAIVDRGHGSAQQEVGDGNLQQDAGGTNGTSRQVKNAALKGLFTDKKSARAVERESASLNNRTNKTTERLERPRQEKPPRPMPSERSYSQQARFQDRQPYSASANLDAYKYNESRTGTAGYGSQERPTDGYGNGGSSNSVEQPYVTPNEPWSSGASRGSNGRYSEPDGYGQHLSRSTPDSLRKVPPRGLPTNPRANR